jgi:hypothetical protein
LGGDLKYDVRMGIYAPTGRFRTGRLANAGKNYWTFEPGVYLRYLSSKIGLEISAYAGMDFNTENEATDYQSGNQFHLDFTIAEHLPLFGGFVGIGASGFYYEQVTGDSGSGARLGSFEGMAVGVGPVLSYATKICQRDVVAEVKWLPELDTEKRLRGITSGSNWESCSSGILGNKAGPSWVRNNLGRLRSVHSLRHGREDMHAA